MPLEPWCVDIGHQEIPLPFTEAHRHFCVRARCGDCGKLGWCVAVLMTPTLASPPCLTPVCGACLGEVGFLLNHRPLELERTSGVESQTVPILHTTKES
jgi:hypothetical protein